MVHAIAPARTWRRSSPRSSRSSFGSSGSSTAAAFTTGSFEVQRRAIKLGHVVRETVKTELLARPLAYVPIACHTLAAIRFQ